MKCFCDIMKLYKMTNKLINLIEKDHPIRRLIISFFNIFKKKSIFKKKRIYTLRQFF